MTCWLHVMPSILLRALVSKPSSLAARGLFSGQVSEPYWRTEMTEALYTLSFVSREMCR